MERFSKKAKLGGLAVALALVVAIVVVANRGTYVPPDPATVELSEIDAKLKSQCEDYVHALVGAINHGGWEGVLDSDAHLAPDFLRHWGTFSGEPVREYALMAAESLWLRAQNSPYGLLSEEVVEREATDISAVCQGIAAEWGNNWYSYGYRR